MKKNTKNTKITLHAKVKLSVLMLWLQKNSPMHRPSAAKMTPKQADSPQQMSKLERGWQVSGLVWKLGLQAPMVLRRVEYTSCSEGLRGFSSSSNSRTGFKLIKQNAIKQAHQAKIASENSKPCHLAAAREIAEIQFWLMHQLRLQLQLQVFYSITKHFSTNKAFLQKQTKRFSSNKQSASLLTNKAYEQSKQQEITAAPRSLRLAQSSPGAACPLVLSLGDLDPVEVGRGLPVQSGIGPGIQVVQIVSNVSVDLVDEREVDDALVEAVASQHQDEDHHGHGNEQAADLQSWVGGGVPVDENCSWFTSSRVVTVARMPGSQTKMRLVCFSPAIFFLWPYTVCWIIQLRVHAISRYLANSSTLLSFKGIFLTSKLMPLELASAMRQYLLEWSCPQSCICSCQCSSRWISSLTWGSRYQRVWQLALVSQTFFLVYFLPIIMRPRPRQHISRSLLMCCWWPMSHCSWVACESGILPSQCWCLGGRGEWVRVRVERARCMGSQLSSLGLKLSSFSCSSMMLDMYWLALSRGFISQSASTSFWVSWCFSVCGFDLQEGGHGSRVCAVASLHRHRPGWFVKQSSTIFQTSDQRPAITFLCDLTSNTNSLANASQAVGMHASFEAQQPPYRRRNQVNLVYLKRIFSEVMSLELTEIFPLVQQSSLCSVIAQRRFADCAIVTYGSRNVFGLIFYN